MFKTIKTDLLVVGGGLSGCFAAIAAKRTSPYIQVWLVEKQGFLGGMATSGYVFPFMPYYTTAQGGGYKRLSGGLFKEMLDRAHIYGYTEEKALNEDFYSRFDPIMLRCLLDTMLLEAGVEVLFHSIVNKVNAENNIMVNNDDEQNSKRITGVIAQTKAGEIEFKPTVVIDATGDADIVYHAGGIVKKGRESDGLTQPATLMFRIGNIGELAAKRRVINKLIKKEKAKGNPLTPRDNCLMFLGNNNRERHFNQTRVAGFDPTDPFEMSKAELEGRMQAERFIRFLREKVPGYEKSTLSSMGSQIGARETRRIIGEYILTEKDLLSCTEFPDRIALGNYPIDIHDPKGSATSVFSPFPKGKWYSVPYRSLVPIGMDNILIAGRPISADHVAHSAIRIMSICSTIGHAAGVSVGIQFNKYPELPLKELNIKEIQDELRKQGAILE